MEKLTQKVQMAKDLKAAKTMEEILSIIQADIELALETEFATYDRIISSSQVIGNKKDAKMYSEQKKGFNDCWNHIWCYLSDVSSLLKAFDLFKESNNKEEVK